MPKVTKQQEVTVVHTNTGGKKLPGGQDEKIVRGEHRMTTGGRVYTESIKKKEE